MIYFQRFGPFPLLAMAVMLSTTGCPASQDQTPANTSQTGAQDQGSDPTMANLAPVSNDPNAQASTAYEGPNNGQEPAASGYQQSAPPPDSGGNYQTSDQSYGQGPGDPGYGQQPATYAPEPPPPLPDYEQPEAPGDDYLWTPGYWAWGDGGYYWVPGVWVEAPYEGALWTPGYWGFWNNSYGFYPGYWGPHIGYYGGVDYGFGYFGFGYQGGYWGGGHFNYNREVNNVRGGRVHNVYDRSVGGYNRGGSRVSFNGGRGGVQTRPRPAELAARHDQHAAPMGAQIQNQHIASTNRAQFANVNHGRPANAVVSRPLAADRNVRAPAAVPFRNQAGAQQQQRQGAPQQQLRPQAPQQQQRQAAPQRQALPQQQQRQATPQQQQRQQAPQRQAFPQQQQRQAAPQQQQRQAAPQRQAFPQQQQRQAAPQQQRQAAPQQQQRQAAPQQQQRQQAPQRQQQQRQPAQQHQPNQERPK